MGCTSGGWTWLPPGPPGWAGASWQAQLQDVVYPGEEGQEELCIGLLHGLLELLGELQLIQRVCGLFLGSRGTQFPGPEARGSGVLTYHLTKPTSNYASLSLLTAFRTRATSLRCSCCRALALPALSLDLLTGLVSSVPPHLPAHSHHASSFDPHRDCLPAW